MAEQFGGVTLVKKVHLDDAGDKLFKGIDLLAKAVGSTLGASGNTVILENDFGGGYITKDGVSVAKAIVVEDPVENLGMTLLKEAAQQTAIKAGDGTTTSVVIAHALLKKVLQTREQEKHPFRELRIGIESALDFTLKALDKRSVRVDDKRLESVSVISCNGDVFLGRIIADAFLRAGENGRVSYQSSGSDKTFVQTREGTHISSPPTSHHFYTDPAKEESVLENPLVFLSASPIASTRQLQNILEYAIKQNRAILLIAELERQPLAALAMNKVKGNFKVNVIPPPSFGLKKQDILDDIALLCGAKVISEELGDALDLITPEVLGSATRVVSNAEGTTLTFDKVSDKKKLNETVRYLIESLEGEDSSILKGHIEQRLALLTAGVAIVNVGAETEVELKEKLDRVEDAVQAVKAAKKEGILPGGGYALSYLGCNNRLTLSGASQIAGAELFFESLLSPRDKILSNAQLAPAEIIDEFKWGWGIDVIDGMPKDLRKAGIIDPTRVTKEALKNATSVALTILSTKAVVSNIRDGNRTLT